MTTTIVTDETPRTPWPRVALWTVPLVLVVTALGLPAVLFTWWVQRAPPPLPSHTPGGSVAPGAATQGTMAVIALRAQPHISWRRTRIGGFVAGGAVIVLLGTVLVLRQFGIGPAASLMAAGRVQADSRILVAEFAATTSDSSLGSVLSQAMRTSLTRTSSVESAPAGVGAAR